MHARLAECLRKQWYQVSLWHILLLPLSWVFYLLIKLRRICYLKGFLARSRLPVPVIVVGNVTVGGTGKTPLVIWLAGWLREHGFTPGVISRGYGGTAKQLAQVGRDSNPAEVGDEPVLIARRTGCPVWVGKKRSDAGKALLQSNPVCNVLICDDGLQHYALERDMEIVMDGGHDSHGNGWLLPAGPLREPLSRLQGTDAVIWHEGESAPDGFVMRLAGAKFRNLTDPERIASAAEFFGLNLHAVAGIGSPKRFFRTLESLGLKYVAHAFPDHHAYCAAELQFPDAQAVLMTEKDAVKCQRFAQPNWWYLEVNAVVSDALGKRILQKLRKC